MDNSKTIFAFDLGTGSIGECVRKEKEVLHLNSLLLPQDFATLKEARERRHQIRTRIAHKKREQWWKQQAKEVGIEVLETGNFDKENKIYIKPDEKISREFAKDGDNTIYTSSLLRIALLQGVKLEGWQIFKAVWSAIQHRGYDAKLPWARKVKRNVEESAEEKTSNEKANLEDEDVEKDEKENLAATEKYETELKEFFGDKKELYYPCYYEEFKMGIWNPENPDDLTKKINFNPLPARNKDGSETLIPPREIVEDEIKKLLESAALIYPKLKDEINFIMYGPGQKRYASFVDKNYSQYRGKEWDWQGIVSQKIPRFDNRIISKCVLIPRLNVCKATDILNKEVVFLMKLKNMRYFKYSHIIRI